MVISSNSHGRRAVTADGIEYLESFMGTKGPDPFTQSIEGFGDDEIERLEETIASRMNASYSAGGFTMESVPTTL